MRRKLKKKIITPPDTKYDSVLVNKFIKRVMRDGKEGSARRIVYGAMDAASKKTGKKPLEMLEDVIDNGGPQMELKSRRVGGANYQIPYPVQSDRKVTLAVRWIVAFARKRKGKPMQDKLAEEFINIINNEGDTIKKKTDTHKMADANKAFAHFAWH